MSVGSNSNILLFGKGEDRGLSLDVVTEDFKVIYKLA